MGLQSLGFWSKEHFRVQRKCGRDSSIGGELKFSRPLIGRKSASWTIGRVQLEGPSWVIGKIENAAEPRD